MNLIKYLLEGLAVAVAAFYIPRRKADLQEIAMIGLTAAAVFLVLDSFSPAVAAGARQGSGFGIGMGITNGLEGFEENENESETTSDTSSEGDSETENAPTAAKVETYTSQPAELTE